MTTPQTDTPRTDAAEAVLNEEEGRKTNCVRAYIARRIERDLAAAESEIASLTNERDDFAQQAADLALQLAAVTAERDDRDTLRDALDLLVKSSYHASACTEWQRELTGCICGATSAQNHARAALAKIAATKGDA